MFRHFMDPDIKMILFRNCVTDKQVRKVPYNGRLYIELWYNEAIMTTCIILRHVQTSAEATIAELS